MTQARRYTVVFLPAAARSIRSLPREAQERVKIATDKLQDEPRPRGVVKLHDTGNLWRIRIGRYRVIYGIEDRALVVTVADAGHRREAYRGL